MAEQPVAMGLRTRMQAVPADFGNGIRLHPSAHCRRQQLATEADAEHGLLRIHRLADELDLGLEVRELLHLVDVHRTAEHDEAVVPANVRLGLRFAAEIHVADAESRRTQQRIEVAERFGGDVLEDEQFRHVRALCFEGPANRAAATILASIRRSAQCRLLRCLAQPAEGRTAVAGLMQYERP